jgi:hypothetical protein
VVVPFGFWLNFIIHKVCVYVKYKIQCVYFLKDTHRAERRVKLKPLWYNFHNRIYGVVLVCTLALLRRCPVFFYPQGDYEKANALRLFLKN